MNKTSLAQGNQAFRDKDYQAAIRHYRNAIAAQPELQKILQKNIELAQKRLGTAAPEASAAQGIAIDIVVPVYNALPDVQACLASLDRCRDGFDVRVIIVNDGSEAPTTEWLRSFAKGRHDVTLIEHASNAGYTRAVNAGLKASTAPFVITQNSDTIVTPGWLKGMVACMESDPRIGIVGPLSNAATWQNVPGLRDGAGDFAINELPIGLTVDEMARTVARVSEQRYPRLPFINGFCFMIRRPVIEAVGYMDEESFPIGYGEEIDYCFRAGDIGYECAAADDVYVFHAKSKSFGHSKRAELSKSGAERIKGKHKETYARYRAEKPKHEAQLDYIRRKLNGAIAAMRASVNEDTARLNRPKEHLPLASQISEEIRTIVFQRTYFDENEYLAHNPDIRYKEVDPFEHYMTTGWAERRPGHSSIYDFNKYLEVYKDVARSGLNPILHYIDKGESEGRRLFYAEHYLKSVSRNQTESVTSYIEKKLSTRRNSAVVAVINLSEDRFVCNPQPLRFNLDYICLGLPAAAPQQESVWSTRPLAYHLDDISKLEAYAIINFAQILGEYDQAIYVVNGKYLNSPAFAAAMSLADRDKTKIVAAGTIHRALSTSMKASIGQFLVELGVKGPDGGEVDLLVPNFVSYKGLARSDFGLLAKWWNFQFDANLPASIPRGILDKIGCQIIEEKPETRNGALVDTAQYLSLMNDYFQRRSFHVTEVAPEVALSKRSVAIIVPVFNALADVKRCLMSVSSSTYRNYHLFIADDASNSETQDWLREFSSKDSRVTLISASANRGYTINVNNALEYCGNFDFTILLNSDTEVAGDWIEKLLQRFADDSTVGIAGPLSNKAGWQSAPNLRGENSSPDGIGLLEINELLKAQNRNDPAAEVDIVNGFCICISREVFKEIGSFDQEAFPQGYGEEDDFCMRARLAGFKNVISLDTYVYHAKSKSMGHEKRIALATKGRKILDEKYGKDKYLALTESIGKNPTISAARAHLSMLLSTKQEKLSIIGERVLHIESRFSKKSTVQPRILVHVHCFYTEMCDYFSHYLKNIPFEYDVVVTTSSEQGEEVFRDAFRADRLKSLRVVRVSNRGRNVYPFFRIVKELDVLGQYDYVLHIHTKRSKHDPLLGVNWISHLLGNLLNSPHFVSNLLEMMEQEGVGLVFPEVLPVHYGSYRWGKNKAIAMALAETSGIAQEALDKPFSFPAGCMFWAKTNGLTRFAALALEEASFPDEPIPIDGTLAHALERMISYLVVASGAKVSPVLAKNAGQFENELEYLERNIQSPKAIERLILEQIANKRPFALIRYFDGEGAFFKSKYWSERYCSERMAYYFGAGNYSIEHAEQIGKKISESIFSADVVGVPNVEIVREVLSFAETYAGGEIEALPNLKRRMTRTIDCTSAWRIVSALQLVLTSVASKAKYVTKDIHYDLVRSGGLYRVIDAAKDVRTITSQPVGPILESIFGKKIVTYEIPGRALDIERVGSTKHYPQQYEKVRKQLLSCDLRGVLVLIGAGPLGKEYCALVKASGGVALDIGAVFDSWVNFLTRPEQGGASGDIAYDLLLTSDNVERLTGSAVKPRKNITIRDLPAQKRNAHIVKLLR